jgi:Quinohemoprotein amine dehydrogenase, gamma subunit
MKHLKAANQKAEAIDRAMTPEDLDEVYAMQSVGGCSTTADPGWEVDPLGGVAHLCQPMEADLYGCADPCWWPAQVPDIVGSYADWGKGVESAERGWRELDTAYPKPVK